jgi:hypothetical protein
MNDDFDMTTTTAAKSNQINADDLIGKSITVTVTGVQGVAGDQPVKVELAEAKPFFPCKSMRRLMVAVWGANAKDYVGHQMTLYRDPSVTYGGMAVGGIRISHVSHIDKEKAVVLRKNKQQSMQFTVKPLVNPNPEPAPKPAAKPTWKDWFVTAGISAEQLKAWMESVGMPGLKELDESARAEIFANPQKYGKLVKEA